MGEATPPFFNFNQMKHKIYVLTQDRAPLNFLLASRHTHRSPLLHFDGTTNRALRYARNQKSPFEDEQDGNAILEPIIFKDGFLHVQATNPVLQQFMDLHPGNGEIFMELDNEKNAQEELDIITAEVDALIAAKTLDIQTMETLGRVFLGLNTDKMSSAELKRDVILFAKNNPVEFLEALEDPMLEIQDIVAKIFEEGLLSMRNKNKDIYFNLPGNKKKLTSVPYGEDPQHIVVSLLQQDGDILNMFEKQLSKKKGE